MGKNRKNMLISVIGLLLLLVAVFIVNQQSSRAWMDSTFPSDGAVQVPVTTTINVTWNQEIHGTVTLKVGYKDEPHFIVPGVLGVTREGASFLPQMLLPGKEVVVTVEAGRKKYQFSFVTAKD